MKSIGLSEVLYPISIVSFVAQVAAHHFKVGENLIYGQVKENGAYLIEGRTDLLIFHPNKNSVVNGMNFQISSGRNLSVEAVVFNENYSKERMKAINFLPVKVDDIFPNLIFYGVYRCAVQIVTRQNFKNLQKLLALDLVVNNIKTLDEDSFDDLTNLKSVNLFRNKIEILPDKIFQNLHELRSVALGGNPIVALNDEHFKNNKKLEYFSIRQSRIKFLSPTMFDEIRTLRRVDLSGNVCIDKEYGTIVTIEHESNSLKYVKFTEFSEHLDRFKSYVTANCSYKL
ncbi:toll-like receptor Tollo [Bradysia coprophila]|uniref:toll-like receptor Tollo n=1 Tax=Bradysia coprophila TaxID=38358 RepID=UPI00187DCBC9|nr:toll-like receptor Tollo [Bradysia coprophila]